MKVQAESSLPSLMTCVCLCLCEVQVIQFFRKMARACESTATVRKLGQEVDIDIDIMS
jgi:hypothetical protein